jgi:hypothetical protein
VAVVSVWLSISQTVQRAHSTCPSVYLCTLSIQQLINLFSTSVRLRATKIQKLCSCYAVDVLRTFSCYGNNWISQRMTGIIWPSWYEFIIFTQILGQRNNYTSLTISNSIQDLRQRDTVPLSPFFPLLPSAPHSEGQTLASRISVYMKPKFAFPSTDINRFRNSGWKLWNYAIWGLPWRRFLES